MTRQSPTYSATRSVVGDLLSLALGLCFWAMAGLSALFVLYMLAYGVVYYPWQTGTIITAAVVWVILVGLGNRPAPAKYEHPEVTEPYQAEKRDFTLWNKELQG